MPSDLGVMLFALDPAINVTEPDEGDNNALISSCFQANVTRMRRRDAVFPFVLLNSSTAYLGSDYMVDHDYIIIPTGFSGLFAECVSIMIIGDNMIEENEVIEYNVLPTAERDSVTNYGGYDPLRVTILDNDGKLAFCRVL